MVKRSPADAADEETRARSLGGEDPLEEGMAAHSSILAWRIPWTEERGALQSTESQRVRQTEHARISFSPIWEENLKENR